MLHLRLTEVDMEIVALTKKRNKLQGLKLFLRRRINLILCSGLIIILKILLGKSNCDVILSST